MGWTDSMDEGCSSYKFTERSLLFGLYLDIKGPGLGDDFKQVIPHQNITGHRRGEKEKKV